MTIDERYFNDFDKQIKDFESVLMPEENILYKTKPNKKSYILSSVFKMLPFALLWLVIDSFFIAIITPIIPSSNFASYALVLIASYIFISNSFNACLDLDKKYY